MKHMKKHFVKRLVLALFGSMLLTALPMQTRAAGNTYMEEAIDLQTNSNLTRYVATSSYSADTPSLTAMWDENNQYHVGYVYQDSAGTGYFVAQRYNESLQLQGTIQVKLELPMYGNFITDGQYYYVVTGLENNGTSNQVATCTAKYTMSGKKVGCYDETGYDANPYKPWGTSGDSWGTAHPFDAGSCHLAMRDNLLVCNYGRLMFNGHQSNYAFFLNTETMTPQKTDAVIYCSHSFDQGVLAASNGDWLFVNQGDAYDRGFKLTEVKKLTYDYGRDFVSFHFREGGARSYGYNETYAQLGGLVELQNSYVLCGSSEKTLSLEEGSPYYLFYNEARNLFVQFLKKDFMNRAGEDCYAVAGETRKPVGTRPSNPKGELWVPANAEDYGVIWLTDYDDAYFVNNPKIVAVGEDAFAVLWEKAKYSERYNPTVETYYAIMSYEGDILTPATLIPNASLPGNSDVDYHNGFIYWVTADGKKKTINCLSAKYTLPLKLREQPANATVYAGDKAEFSVYATGTGLQYQWQKSTDGGKTWVNSGSEGAATDTLTMTAKLTYNNLKFRCVIKDAAGKKLISNAVTLAVRQILKINTQPSNKTVTAGDTVTFAVKAAGDGLKYRWKKSTDGGVTWTNSASEGAATDTLQMSTKLAYNGYLFKCVISDRYGESLETKAVTLTVRSPLAITANPVNVTVEAGNTARFTVKATGDNLTYQWKKSTDGGVTWVNSSSTGAATGTLSITAKAGFDGLQFKCVVKDKYGKSVSSTAATLAVTVPLIITSQPGNVTAAAGKTVSFKVAASGEGLSYQWKKSTDGGATWVNSASSGAQSAMLTMTVKGSYDGYCFRCVVTDQRGKKVTSETAKLTVSK